MITNKETKLEEARQFLIDNYEKGCKCPLCKQFVKQYKRKLNSSMAYGLIILYRLHKKHGFSRYFQMNQEIAKLKIPSSNIEYPKLAYWNLIEEKENTDEAKKTSGLWKITDRGIAFVTNRIRVQSHVRIYNNEVKGFTKTQTTITQSLGNKFNYKELMEA